jgi:hypothetical protein
LRAILRRRHAPGSVDVLRFGRLEIDKSAREVRVDGQRKAMTGHQFSLLLILAERAGRVLSRDTLMDLTRGESLEDFDRSIDVHVSRLRAAIEDDPRRPRLEVLLLLPDRRPSGRSAQGRGRCHRPAGEDESGEKVKTVFHSIRQQTKKPAGQYNVALSDFVKPKTNSGSKPATDYIGGFAVTTGIGIDEHVARFEKDHDDYNSIMIKAIADRLAEAFAELMHARVRKEFWGYGRKENLSNEDLIEEKYQGIRPAPGYPACPDHTEKRILFDLLDAENQIDIKLTESFAMYPASSVSGWYFSHPESKYFGLGKIAKDQVEEYAKRKGMSVEDVERWMAPNLNYD